MLTRTSASSPCVVVPTIHTARHVKVRYWHEADMVERLSASGTKRTNSSATAMSANDPKQTSYPPSRCLFENPDAPPKTLESLCSAFSGSIGISVVGRPKA
jgi:hypothetical protein